MNVKIETAKCKCQHCSAKMEFESHYAGQEVECPSCKMPTLLFIPSATATAPVREEEVSFDKKRVLVILAIIALLTIICFVATVSDPESEISAVVVIPLGLCAGILYFAPSLIASKKRQFPALFALNLLLGWTFLGWVAALVWAMVKEKSPV